MKLEKGLQVNRDVENEKIESTLERSKIHGGSHIEDYELKSRLQLMVKAVWLGYSMCEEIVLGCLTEQPLSKEKCIITMNIHHIVSYI